MSLTGCAQRIQSPTSGTECYLRPEYCRMCGGQCCKTMPGCTLPEDWGSTREEIERSVVAGVAAGKYVVDWWEGDPRGYAGYRRAPYVRPRALQDKHILSPLWVGQCVFLAEDGCVLAPEDRPAGCRLLEPRPAGESCVPHGAGKREAAIAWLPYTQFLLQMELHVLSDFVEPFKVA